jgi:LytS/YehU family sensor histidine kinase
VIYILFEAYIEFAWISASFAAMAPAARFIMAYKEEFYQLIIKVPLVYFIFYLVYNRAIKSKYLIVPLLGVAIAIAVAIVAHRVLVLKFLLPYIYLESAGDEKLFTINRVISSLLDILLVVGMAVVAKQYRQHQRWKEKEKSLVKEKLEAELKFLRSQTNPHFLFNTLNNIYALARKKSDDTADTVMKLSKILRFMLYESKKETISIAEELRVLDDYIELERIRYNDRLKLNFKRNVDDDRETIAPLILLPFVENAFKHGASETRFDSFIDIDMQLKNGKLNFTISNSKDEEGESAIMENIGLSNTRRQLELMYPEHKLVLANGKNSFSANLIINLRNHAKL